MQRVAENNLFFDELFYPGFCLNFDPKCHFSQKHTPGLVSKRLRDFHFSRILTISTWSDPNYRLYSIAVQHMCNILRLFKEIMRVSDELDFRLKIVNGIKIVKKF